MSTETEKTPVWLLSTEQMGSLFGDNNSPKILFSRENSIEIPIESIKVNDSLTLIDFYSDFLVENACDTLKYDFKDSKRKRIEEIKICEKLSGIKFKSIFKHKNHNVFITHSYPKNSEHPVMNDAKKYWLIAYANTVALYLNLNIEQIEFFGILHGADTDNNINDFINEKISMDYVNSGMNKITINIKRTKYSHSDENEIRDKTIFNPDFFKNLDPSKGLHNFMLEQLSFPGIFERSAILKAIGQNLTKEDVRCYYLNCKVDDLTAKKKEFCKVFGKTELELL